MTKHDIFPPKGPMPFNPFGPDGMLEDTTIKEKRANDPDREWPWNTPEGSIPRPLAKRAPVKTVPTWPPPFVKEEEIEGRKDLAKRGGSVSASASESCKGTKCERKIEVTATWTFG